MPLRGLIADVRRTRPSAVVGAGQTISVGQVVETDLAQAITSRKIRTVEQVVEADLAQVIARIKTRGVGQVVETDLAQAVSWAPKRRLVNQVLEADLAQVINAILGVGLLGSPWKRRRTRLRR